MRDVGMLHVQSAGGIAAIAFFGDCQGNDMRRRARHRRDRCRRIVGRDQHIGDSPDDSESLALRGALNHGVEAILRHKLLAHTARAARDPHTAPVTAGSRQDIVKEDRLMRPVKRAYAQMHDADAVLVPVVRGTVNVSRQSREEL